MRYTGRFISVVMINIYFCLCRWCDDGCFGHWNTSEWPAHKGRVVFFYYLYYCIYTTFVLWLENQFCFKSTGCFSISLEPVLTLILFCLEILNVIFNETKLLEKHICAFIVQPYFNLYVITCMFLSICKWLVYIHFYKLIYKFKKW